MMDKFTAHCKTKLNLLNSKLGEEYYYASIPLAVIDAVYSIRLGYDEVKRIVANYRTKFGDNHTITDLVHNIESMGIEKFIKEVIQKEYMTAGQNPISKAEAVYLWAKALQENGVETFEDWRSTDTTNLEKELMKIRGQGQAVVKYFSMLCGGENTCKPDTHLLRFLTKALGRDVNAEEAQQVLEDAVKDLKAEYPHMTVRLLDYIIWNYQKNLKK